MTVEQIPLEQAQAPVADAVVQDAPADPAQPAVAPSEPATAPALSPLELFEAELKDLLANTVKAVQDHNIVAIVLNQLLDKLQVYKG